MVLALVLVFILILFLVAIITAAVSAADGGSNRSVSVAELPPRPHRPKVASRHLTQAPVGSSVPYREMDATEARIHFTAIGRTNFERTDDLTISHEGFFVSANTPFKGGSRNDGDGGICFLTGQRRGTCQ